MLRLVPFLASALLVAGLCRSAGAQDVKQAPDHAKEPISKDVSLDRGEAYLDRVSVEWTRKNRCGSCHTNYPCLLAVPGGKVEATAAQKEVRAFFEDRAANWDRKKPRWDTEVVATAATLAVHDARTTGKLHPVTRDALDRMWTLQRKDGAWDWLKCDWPPLEHDDYFGALFAAVGVGHAPEEYAKTEKARDGVARLRDYFAKTAAPDLHHRTWLLWASLRLEGLQSEAQRKETVKELLARQREDGGWSLPSLGGWKRRDGSPNDKAAPSDGYATGLVVFVLMEAGLKTDEAQVAKGLAWLRANQRESGRWFTRSLNNDRYHYISHTGTAFALMALRAAEKR